MDLNSFKAHPTRSTFFSRVYTTPQPSNNPRSYLSTTRPHANTPSFFGKRHIPHSAGGNSEFHTASAAPESGDSSTSLPPVDAEDSSIYAGHKSHRYFSQTIEDANTQHPYDNMDGVSHVSYPPRLEPSFSANRAGAVEKRKQDRSLEDLTADRKKFAGMENVLFAVPRVTNPQPHSVLTPSDHTLDSGCTPMDSSASARIISNVEEGGEDDIPVSVRKSFKELRSVKDELERQRSENERLRADLVNTQKEVSDTLARLDKMKQMSKRSIESTSNTLAELHTELASLKSQSDESFAFAAQARSDLPDISDLRAAIKYTSENCHRIMEDLAKAAEMKRLIRDLELECANARKANDFLRDKLTDVTSQYADATARLQSAECTHANQTDALRGALDDLHNANLLVAAHTVKLDITQKELSDALIACAVAKEDITRLEKR
ncbi:hypothetical protein BJV74DRAFT_571718 [Russula compacta]|nr:hypothetical protein BJV74DRAFT_571718 [Russula compacta]